MNKAKLLFILCFFSSFSSFGQLSNLSTGPEVLGPLKVNAELTKVKKGTAVYNLKSPGPPFYFVLDTLVLPFVDDFSTYNLKSYDTLNYNQSLVVVDSLSFAFTIDSIPVASFICVADTTWSYIFNDTMVPALVSKTPLTSYQIVNYSDPYNPFVPTDTSVCWSPYEVYDTVNYPTSPDTIDTAGIVIDTLTNSFDSLTVYPPDTGVGGKVLSLWIDENVFINSRYPIDPVTIGVATFDGLDEFGKPYNSFSDPSGYGVADFLTSKPIDLSLLPTDSVYISFYYQPEGIGNDPQPEDSLVLEFYAPAKRTWYHAWSTTGKSSHAFRHVILPISNLDYLKKGFQFRFKNYATISGAYDHWHLDYVRLNKNRNEVDSVIPDIAIVTATRSIFQSYEAVPWKHYLADSSLTLLPQMDIHMHNLDTANNFCGYKYSIKHNDGTIDSTLVLPLSTNEFDVPGQSELSRSTALDYYCSWSNNADSAVFEVTSFLVPAVQDTIRINDTLKYFQEFYNYYAYDDGTAEATYGLNAVGGKLAYKFTSLNPNPDTLRAIDMYFAQNEYDHSDEFFYLTVWKSLVPEIILYQQKSLSPVYEDSLNEFHTYLLDTVLLISGSYYIGWVQLSDDILNIGYDFNRDASSNVFYNTAGTWVQSLLGGTVMMRPLFGDTVIIPMTIEEPIVLTEISHNFSIFPNPASDLIQIQAAELMLDNGSVQVIILDLYGREVISEFNSTGTVDIKHLSDGIYFVKVRIPGALEFETLKIFVSH